MYQTEDTIQDKLDTANLGCECALDCKPLVSFSTYHVQVDEGSGAKSKEDLEQKELFVCANIRVQWQIQR